ncbi:choice-of-anchor L domain-containing protein [Marnyiella aurantia]|uniref:Choice-of-anchor L domain-containing protein n=1 Tax=Marnyiella aurantia TaxID=2758037 RepID=A0A7D7QWR0_9FLAO|nr:choice-of-anchor L domain-containing protein [Marnyiella aurantia]MBA5245558.1 choice-of-anchor L domain-containing protein [Marnyiella aurantia]QMS99030.1 choice-of-anchor L domain-containing protein [Marnyiella aurantia]
MLNYRLKNYFSISFIALSLLTTTSVFGQKTRPPAMKEINPLAKAGDFIDVNVAPYPESNFTPAQLVTDVLVGASPTCGTPNISNVTISPNQPVTDNNRFWGYFNKGTSQFPFDEGIVLTTGFARKAGNLAETFTLGDVTGTNSDPDLVAATNPSAALHNAVVLEFDFVPASTQMKFNYIFASEEYDGGFPCLGYDDAFALLLKPNTPGATYTNIAVLPGGAGPVTATNIVPASFSCGPINAQYFGSLPPNQTNYYGRTIPLEATATVIPGQSYHIKMVIADARDSGYDSAVFLEAGSFDIGVQILNPNGVALPAEVEMCDNTPQSLTASVQVPGATYQWSLNGNIISGATNPTYVATAPGVYSIQVFVPGNQCPGEASVTILGGTSPVVNNITFTQCYAPGNVNFNLNLTTTAISSTPGVTYAFYEDLADAQAQNANVIANPGAFSSPGNVTVYALVKSGFCPKIAEIQLVKAPQITVDIAPPPAINCTNPQVTLLATSSTYPAGSVFSWVATNGGYIFSGANTLTPVVAAGGNYTLTITKAYQPGDVVCSATGTVTVQENFTPPTVTVSASDMKVCAGYPVVLTATGGATYVWNTNASPLNVITVAPTQTTTYTVYSVGANGCQSTNPATITIEVIPAITTTLQPVAGQICVGDSIILDAGAGPAYTYEWKDEDDIVIGNSQTVTVDEMGIYTVTIGNGECTATFSTQVVQAQIPQVINADFQTNTLTLTASNPSNGPLEYSIDNGFTWQDSNVFTNVAANITLNLQVRVKHTSCVGELPFFTLHIQNVITPNGDGVNDVLDLSGISRYKDFGASVYDRYGKEIWRATKDAAIWTGRFQSKTLPTSTYWYQVKYEDPANKNPINKTGWIMLKNRE